MIVVWLLGLGAALAGSAPPPPPPVPATATGECPTSIPLRIGQPVPALLLGPAGLVGCSAVAEPLSSYGHLLQLEQDSRMVRELYAIEVERLTTDRDYWRTQAEKATDRSWYRSPWFVAVTTSALSAAVFLTYDRL